MADKIKCSDCEYAVIDRKASEYTKKHCKTCEAREKCEVCRGCGKYGNCKSRINPNHKQSCGRRFETVCSQQQLNWAAYQCANRDSEYHRALLNVTPNGDRQERVTWGGCTEGGVRA